MRAGVLFWKKAAAEYRRLSFSQQQWMGAATRRLEQQGTPIGKQLPENRYSQLAGFQELRNSRLGISLIFCAAQNGEVEIIQIEQTA